MLRIKDARNFRRSVAGLSLIGGPALLLVNSFLQPGQGNDASGPYLDALAASPGRTQVSAILFIFGFMLFAPGAVGIVHLIRRRGVVLAHVGGVLSVVGAIAFVGLATSTFYDLSIAENAPRPVGIRVYEGIEDYAGTFVVLLPALVGLLVGLILLAIALWRAGHVPPWLPPAVVVAMILIMIGTEVTSPIAAALLLATFGYVGLLILRSSDDDWERGTLAAARASAAP